MAGDLPNPENFQPATVTFKESGSTTKKGQGKNTKRQINRFEESDEKPKKTTVKTLQFID